MLNSPLRSRLSPLLQDMIQFGLTQQQLLQWFPTWETSLFPIQMKKCFLKKKTGHKTEQLLFKILENTLFHRLHTEYSFSLLLSIFTVKYFWKIIYLSAAWSHQVPVNFVLQKYLYQMPADTFFLCSDLLNELCTTSVLKRLLGKLEASRFSSFPTEAIH